MKILTVYSISFSFFFNLRKNILSLQLCTKSLDLPLPVGLSSLLRMSLCILFIRGGVIFDLFCFCSSVCVSLLVSVWLRIVSVTPRFVPLVCFSTQEEMGNFD